MPDELSDGTRPRKLARHRGRSSGGQGVDAAHAAQPRELRRPRTVRGLIDDQAVHPIAAGGQHLVAGDMLGEDQLHERLVERQAAQPRRMTTRPGRTRPRIKQANDATAACQRGGDRPSDRRVDPHGTARDRAAPRAAVRNQDRPQLPSRMQPRELQRVARIGLDPVARLTIAPGAQTITSNPQPWPAAPARTPSAPPHRSLGPGPAAEIAEILDRPVSTVSGILRLDRDGQARALGPGPRGARSAPRRRRAIHIEVKQLGRIQGGAVHRVHGLRRLQRPASRVGAAQVLGEPMSRSCSCRRRAAGA